MKLLLSMFVVCLTLPAFAERICTADREKFCGNVERGEGRVARCMKENEANLSPACRDFRAKRKAASREVAAECADDAVELCATLVRGEKKKCLFEKIADVSPECKAKLESLQNVKESGKIPKGQK